LTQAFSSLFSLLFPTAVSLLDDVLPAPTIRAGVWDIFPPEPVFRRAEISEPLSLGILVSLAHAEIKCSVLDFPAFAAGVATDGAGAIAFVSGEEFIH
jgi:hypothetical protein